MNELINRFLLAGDKFIAKMQLRQYAALNNIPAFTYSACGPITKSKEKIRKCRETEDSRYIFQNQLDKACFHHDMVYGDFKVLPRRTASEKVLRDKSFNLLTVKMAFNNQK